MDAPAGGGASTAVVLWPVGGAVVPGATADAPPPSPVPRPAGILDLPPELLARVFAHLWALTASPVTAAVPGPTVGLLAAAAAKQDEPTAAAPLVTACTWSALAPAARVCRAFRAAFLASVEHLCVEVSDRRAVCSRPEALLPRWTALAAALRRLTSLRTLDLRLGDVEPRWVVNVVINMVADTVGSGVPSLRALSLEAGDYVDMALRRMAAGQPRLAHLSLSLTTPATDDHALLLGALYKGMAGRLQSMDLRPLRCHSEADALDFLQSLPTLRAVRAVHLDGHGWAGEAGLTALAATCPAVEALTVEELAPELRSGAGAAALLRLFPSLHTLAVGASLDRTPGAPVPLPFVAALCAGRQFTTLVLPFVSPGAEPLTLAQALGGGHQPPAHLRLNGLVDEALLAGLRGASLSTLSALHLSDVKLDKGAVAALTSLTGLVSLSLCTFPSAVTPLPLVEDVLVGLAPPSLRHLHLERAELCGAAGAGLVAAMARATPQTLRSLSLSACNGEVAAAMYGLAGVRSFRRLGLVDHQLLVMEVQKDGEWASVLADVAESCRTAKAFLAAVRPDIVVYEGE